MSTSDDRVSRNDLSFRAANERIAHRRSELRRFEGPTPFLCECDDPECLDIVLLATSEYERVRSEPSQYVVVPGHPLPGTETGLLGDGWVCVRREGG